MNQNDNNLSKLDQSPESSPESIPESNIPFIPAPPPVERF